jgi:hypothetical protein
MPLLTELENLFLGGLQIFRAYGAASTKMLGNNFSTWKQRLVRLRNSNFDSDFKFKCGSSRTNIPPLRGAREQKAAIAATVFVAEIAGRRKGILPITPGE